MKTKFKKPQHTPGPWKAKLTSDWLTTRTQDGKEVALYSGNGGSIRFTLKQDIANTMLGSAGPEMLQFIKDWVLSTNMDPKQKKEWDKKHIKIALEIIDKAQNQKVPLKIYYYYIYSKDSEPMFLTERQAFSDGQKSRDIKQIEAKNIQQARTKIRDAKNHISIIRKK